MPNLDDDLAALLGVMDPTLADTSDAGLAKLWAEAQMLDTLDGSRTLTDWTRLPEFDPHDPVWAGIQHQVWTELAPPKPLPWRRSARPTQLPPRGRWRHWLIMAGRGWGKTFVGSNWLAERALTEVGDYAVVAPTLGDAKKICVEGESGLLAALGGEDGPNIQQYNRSEYVITLVNGSRIVLGSADAPARIRGWNLRAVWCVAEGEPVETRRGRIPIEEVRVGDEVMTRDGWKRVTAATRTKRDAPVLRITTPDGSLRCTADHPVWVVDKGWTLAGDIAPGDTLLSWTNEKDAWSDGRTPSQGHPHGTSGAKSAGTATLVTATTATAPDTCCTTPCGPNCTEPSRTDTRYTTSTTTAPTTVTPTCDCSNAANTPATTARRAPTCGGITSHPEQPATGPRPHGSGDSPATSSAISAAPCSSRRECEPGSATSTAPRATAVLAVENDSTSDVYDLTVEGAHEFYAGTGSLLVHNCDEVGSWRDITVWNEGIKFATRKGDPRIVITTTPTRGNKILVRLLDAFADAGGSILGGLAGNTHLTRGSTRENERNLSRDWLDEIEEEFGGTELGRQELDGELLRAVPGALITLDIIEQTRLTAAQVPDFHRVAVGVDPSVSDSEDADECGIVVMGIGPPPIGWEPPPGAPSVLARSRHLYVLEDASLRTTPESWARRALDVADEWNADVLTPERNNGGALVTTMVRMVAQNEGRRLPRIGGPDGRGVWASVGKMTRAEPMGGVWQQHRVHVVGKLKLLEDQWQTWVPGSGQPSPDRFDASVWGGVELMPQLAAKPRERIRVAKR